MSKYNITIDTIEPNLKTLSIKINGWTIDDNGDLKIIKERRAFTPGQIEHLSDWLNEFAPETDASDTLNIVNVMWTPEVVLMQETVTLNNAVNQLKEKWPELDEDKELWSQEQKIAYNNEVPEKYKLEL